MKAGRDVDVPSEVVMVLVWFPRFSAALPSVGGWNAEAAPTIGNSQHISEELVLGDIWGQGKGILLRHDLAFRLSERESSTLTKSWVVE